MSARPTNDSDSLPAPGAPINWREQAIEGCTVEPLTRYTDARGWLAEFFRTDELAPALQPVMGYLSLTHPGVARGPHEHLDQTDLFVFFSGTFVLYLWDIRDESPTYGCRQRLEVGAANPVVAVVPPGVVHAYRNTGDEDALIINCPNRLYAGEGKKGPVDEIRHEDQEHNLFLMD